ncbi:MAG: NADH-quinone oxidoreductase subunit A [Candidatus Aminicenantia bacterium]
MFSKLIHPKKKTPQKLIPYECGVDPETETEGRYSIRYYLIALLFIIFEVETIFLFPWAVLYKKLALFGFIEMFIFLGILILGYFYIWKTGALEYGAE